MHLLRLILYGASAICFAVMAYNLVAVRHMLARWLGALLVANAVNSTLLFAMVIYVRLLGGDRDSVELAWTVNALISAGAAIGLLFAFYRATHNGNGP